MVETQCKLLDQALPDPDNGIHYKRNLSFFFSLLCKSVCPGFLVSYNIRRLDPSRLFF